MRLLMKEHVLLVTWLLWLQTCRDVGAQNVCPHNEPRCQVSANRRMVFLMKCTGYGALTQLPDACNDMRVISSLIIGQGDGNDTTVDELQSRILDGLRVRQLELVGLGIRSINDSAFEAISGDLRVLHLQDNQLESLPAGVFQTLIHLDRLQLHNNRLTELSEGMFSGLTNLFSLTLNENRISAVEPETWYSMPRLVILALEDNRLGDGRLQFPGAALDTLEELRLERNGLRSINDTTSALPNLRRLYFRSNRVEVLLPDVFRFNPRLEILDLSANNISQLSGTAFNGLASLTMLMLDENNIRQLPGSPFHGLNSLQILRMRDNKLSDVYPNSFTGLVVLRDLDLAVNRLSTLPLGMFDALGFLETLSLANNKIRHVEKTLFQSCRNLRTLDMAYNLLPGISDDWFGPNTKLTVLKLAYNQMENIREGSFDQLQHLQELDLSLNFLSDLGINLFTRCRSLQKLNLARNPFRELASLGTTFSGLQALQQLDLTGCCITELVLNSSAPLPALTELYLGNNLLTELSRDSLEAATRLQRLDLTDNNIAAVEGGALSSLASLNWLNLSRNLLTEDQLAAAVQSIPSGVIVDASRNRIKSIASLTIPLRGLYLSGNPLVCSCTSPSWISLTDTSRFLDASKTLCSSGNEQAYLLCYWSRCGTSSDHPLCDAAIPRTTNSSTANVPSKMCRLDDRFILFRPRFIYFEAHVLSSTSAHLRWNVSDEFSTTAEFQVTFKIVDNCTDASAASFSASGNETRSMRIYSLDATRTSARAGNLTSGKTYVACAHVLQLPTIVNRMWVSDTRCTCLKLPAEVRTTLPPPTPAPDLLIWTTPNDTTILVTWTVEGSDYQLAYFRLICFDEDSRQVTSADVEGHSYVIENLSQNSTYKVCVTAVTSRSGVDLTRCVAVQTDVSPTDSAVSLTTGQTGGNLPAIITVVVAACLLVGVFIASRVYRRRRMLTRPGKLAESSTSSLESSSSSSGGTDNGDDNPEDESAESDDVNSPLSEQAASDDVNSPLSEQADESAVSDDAKNPMYEQAQISMDVYDDGSSAAAEAEQPSGQRYWEDASYPLPPECLFSYHIYNEHLGY